MEPDLIARVADGAVRIYRKPRRPCCPQHVAVMQVTVQHHLIRRVRAQLREEC
jgi:hypothetical protein